MLSWHVVIYSKSTYLYCCCMHYWIVQDNPTFPGGSHAFLYACLRRTAYPTNTLIVLSDITTGTIDDATQDKPYYQTVGYMEILGHAYFSIPRQSSCGAKQQVKIVQRFGSPCFALFLLSEARDMTGSLFFWTYNLRWYILKEGSISANLTSQPAITQSVVTMN